MNSKRSNILAEIRAYLLTRRDTLKGYISGELSSLGSDDDSESLDDEMYFVMAESEAKELELIQDALGRFRDDRFGICESCDAEIPIARLRALPCTCRCIECQREFESTSRPALTQDTRRYDFSDIAIG
ncbi:MAG: TraR/DksA family transcriptional regulator [Planctomycetales bacterium]|nr:TraR/DksA family transcriptional regulator [Planctomycetales bacterium]